MTDGRQFMSPYDVTFTPDGGGSPVVFGHVSRVVYDEQADLVGFAGDNDLGETCVAAVKLRFVAAVELLTPGAMDAVKAGTRGTLAWTAGSSFAGNTPGGGGVRYTLARATFTRRPVDLPYYKLSGTAYAFRASSADGQNSPLSSAAV